MGFLSRTRAFFAAHGIHRVVRVVTDNGANYRAAGFARSLTSWVSRHQRDQALHVHYNYHRPHTTAGNRPPASRLHANVTNVMASNT